MADADETSSVVLKVASLYPGLKVALLWRGLTLPENTLIRSGPTAQNARVYSNILTSYVFRIITHSCH